MLISKDGGRTNLPGESGKLVTKDTNKKCINGRKVSPEIDEKSNIFEWVGFSDFSYYAKTVVVSCLFPVLVLR